MGCSAGSLRPAGRPVVRVFSPIVDPFARKRGFAHHALRATRLVVNNEGMGKGSNLVVHRKFGGQPSSVRRPSKAVAWCLDCTQRLRVNGVFCRLASTGRQTRRARVFADRRSFPAKKRIRSPRAARNATCGEQRGVPTHPQRLFLRFAVTVTRNASSRQLRRVKASRRFCRPSGTLQRSMDRQTSIACPSGAKNLLLTGPPWDQPSTTYPPRIGPAG